MNNNINNNNKNNNNINNTSNTNNISNTSNTNNYFLSNITPLFYVIDSFLLTVQIHSIPEKEKQLIVLAVTNNNSNNNNSNNNNPTQENNQIQNLTQEELNFIQSYQNKHFLPVYQVTPSLQNHGVPSYLVSNKNGVFVYVEGYNYTTRQGFIPVFLVDKFIKTI